MALSLATDTINFGIWCSTLNPKQNYRSYFDLIKDCCEIEKMYRFLDEGEEFETHHDEEDHGDEDKPWGHVFAASLIVQMVTLVGVFVSLMVGAYNKKRMERGRSSVWAMVHDIIIPSFAGGALLATVVFLLVPEAFELIGGGHSAHGDEAHAEEHHEDEGEGEHNEDEGGEARRHRMLEEGELEQHNDTAWKFGASLLGGFLLPAILHAIIPSRQIESSEDIGEEKASDSTSRADLKNTSWKNPKKMKNSPRLLTR